MIPTIKISLVVLGVLCSVATVLPLLPLRDWWIRAFDFPRLQLAIMLGLILALLGGCALYSGVRRTWVAAGVALILVASLGYQVKQIVQYTALVSPQAERATREGAEQITLIVANVLIDNRDASRLLTKLRAEQPDLLLAVETDTWWREQLAVLDADYPYRVLRPLDNTYGIALYSRLELIDPQVRYLIEDDVPSIETRVALPSGAQIQLYCLHPRPPTPFENLASTERDAELLVVGAAAKRSPLAVIVAGDMNDVAWSSTTRRFQRISGLLDPRIGRGIYATYHAKFPLMRWPLDHVFFSEELRLVEMRRLGRFGSDHFPILITLSHEPGEREGHEEVPSADLEDRVEAREVIEDARDKHDPDSPK
ncbi:hypothetical protein ENSA5_15030 [Enhygromyxa salina]|uniref:Endonuclease/exonuclease/phosphatase domain-containing protein n=1 Tax=Enhygromyxa salina TaxID=215803 RepID=A0A2S9YEF6_9BACT|nr:endonuclease/exonuclease/phosphatase family protein [Enhygromyxa salina]PRQ03473.1 hypothetical protein ENSA5_15030 [Enhygromyxa salina]